VTRPDVGVVLHAPGEVALEEIHVAEPGPGEVRVRIEATGVCHSDLHVIENDGWGHALPVLLGHEGAGIVEDVGDGVTSVATGDRVVIGWKAACGRCAPCLRGEPRQCKRPPAAPGRLGEGRADFAFDVVGRRETFELALSLAPTVVLIGLSPPDERAEVVLPGLFARRARIVVSHGGDHLPTDFPQLAQWALDGQLDLAAMVTRTAPLADWAEAFDAMRAGDVIRTVLTP